MSSEGFKEFIKNAKDKYKKIGYVECPAFQGEKVYFNNKGFNHLLRKGRRFRLPAQQRRRICLLKYAPKILKESDLPESHRKACQIMTKKNVSAVSTAYFWSFKKVIHNRIVFVVVCQINNEPKNFLSVMDKKLPKNTKVPEGTL